jgi:hypothetical protein
MLRLFLLLLLVCLSLRFIVDLQGSIQRYTHCLGAMLVERIYDPQYTCRFNVRFDFQIGHNW